MSGIEQPTIKTFCSNSSVPHLGLLTATQHYMIVKTLVELPIFSSAASSSAPFLSEPPFPHHQTSVTSPTVSQCNYQVKRKESTVHPGLTCWRSWHLGLTCSHTWALSPHYLPVLTDLLEPTLQCRLLSHRRRGPFRWLKMCFLRDSPLAVSFLRKQKGRTLFIPVCLHRCLTSRRISPSPALVLG